VLRRVLGFVAGCAVAGALIEAASAGEFNLLSAVLTVVAIGAVSLIIGAVATSRR
jgi:hypothetical protein